MSNSYCGGGGGGGYGAPGGNAYQDAGGGGGGYGINGAGGHYNESGQYIEPGFAAGAGGYFEYDNQHTPSDKHYGGNGICLISYYA